jgi:hypothetical protein
VAITASIASWRSCWSIDATRGDPHRDHFSIASKIAGDAYWFTWASRVSAPVADDVKHVLFHGRQELDRLVPQSQMASVFARVLKPKSKRQVVYNVVYNAWLMIRQVCTNPNNRDYRLYGGRGITMCDRWRESFKSFHADVGDRPDKEMRLARIDKTGNYEPSNVRWEPYPRRRR